MSDIRALVRDELATPVDPRAAAMAAAIAAQLAGADLVLPWTDETQPREADLAAARVAAARVDEGLPNDNVSMSVFLKYLEALQLLPESNKKPGPASTASDAQQQINAMRQGLKVVS